MSLLYKVLTYALYTLLALLVWVIWRFYVKQVLLRRNFRKHSNVYILSNWYTPIIGDLNKTIEMMEKDKWYDDHITMDAIQNSKVSFKNIQKTTHLTKILFSK